jgi:superfamily II DNA or RNA helicase
MANLRGFQQEANDKTRHAHRTLPRGKRNVMVVIPTGGGKTVCMGDMARHHDGWGVSMAHRKELVGQISKAFAREGIVHSVAAAKNTVTDIQTEHYEEFGRSFINQNKADWTIASVDTVKSKNSDWGERFRRATLGVIDEGHHALKKNKWGEVFGNFSDEVAGILYTATPCRADGKGLGRDFDGIVDEMIEGPGMRWCIDNGYLTDYDYRGFKVNDLDLTKVKTTTTGELNKEEAAALMRSSKYFVGEVVGTYVSEAMGKLGVCFAQNIEEAQKLTDQFNRSGVPAALVTADTPSAERRNILRRFRARELLMLVNVDLFGEGFDLPAIEIVIMARATASFSLYAQQWGRVLRLMISPILAAAWDTYTPLQRLMLISQSDKPRGVIHDHVGNLIRHGGPPDQHKLWSLAARSRSGADDGIPLRNCDNKKCAKPFERIHHTCPHCGKRQDPPASSSGGAGPQVVDGDIYLYSDEELAKLRGDASKIDRPQYIAQQHQGTAIGRNIANMQAELQREQRNLRHAMNCWAGMFPNADIESSTMRFFHTFKLDVLAAMCLKAQDARELRERITAKMLLAGYIINDLPFPDTNPHEQAA